MADEILDGTAMIGQLFGEGERVTHQPRDALSEGVIETLNTIGFTDFFRDRFVLLSWDHALVGFILIRIEHRLRALHLWQIRPQLLRTITTAIADVKRNDLACLLVHGDPEPLLVGLLFHEATHLIRFHLKTPYDHILWGRHGCTCK